jgi:thiol-disulfide isomerase/thioredoxin
MEQKSKLMEFYGTECSHCRSMEPLIEILRDKEGVEILRLEVWHNQENANLLRQYDQGRCGGVPFFYNTKTEKWLCGSVNYEKLREWALGE